MEKNLQTLALLREKYKESPDSLKWIDDAETTLRSLIEQKQMATNPAFIAIAKDAQKRLNDINALLMNDEKLPEFQRAVLFEAKKVWKFNLDRFGVAAYDDAIELLTRTLDQKLTQ